MMKTMLLAAAVIAGLAEPAVAQVGSPVVGTYSVEGTCPGQGGTYRGAVTITRPGALYALRWVLTSGQVSTARAVEQDGRLAIAYELDGGGGVMIARPTTTGWDGNWAFFNSRAVCVERWQRR